MKIRKGPSCYDNKSQSRLLIGGGQIAATDVVVTQGCVEALVLCLRAVTKPGDTIAMESPTYFGFYQIIKSLGLQVVEIPIDPKTGVDIELLERIIDREHISACLFITNFSNPMGSCMPNDRKKALVELLAGREIPLIEDDIYGDLYFGKARPRTCKSYDQNGLVLLCSSVSKSLAPGYRVGWCIPGRYKKAIIEEKMGTTLCASSPTQYAVAHFLETGRYDIHIRKLRKQLHLQYLNYLQAVTNYFPSSIKVSSPTGGFVLWIELDKQVDALQVFDAAILRRISFAPGHLFGADARYANFIRINFGAPFTTAIDESIRVLGDLIRDADVSVVGLPS